MSEVQVDPLSDRIAALARGLWELTQGQDAVEFPVPALHRLCDLLRDMSRECRGLENGALRRILPDTTMPCALLRGRNATVTLDDPYDGGDAA